MVWKCAGGAASPVVDVEVGRRPDPPLTPSPPPSPTPGPRGTSGSATSSNRAKLHMNQLRAGRPAWMSTSDPHCGTNRFKGSPSFVEVGVGPEPVSVFRSALQAAKSKRPRRRIMELLRRRIKRSRGLRPRSSIQCAILNFDNRLNLQGQAVSVISWMATRVTPTSPTVNGGALIRGGGRPLSPNLTS